MRKLLALLADPLQALYDKGEVKPHYYNPSNVFSEIHFVSPARREIDPGEVQCLVGDARMAIHALGHSYYAEGFLPFGRVASLARAIGPHVVRAYDPGVRGSMAVRLARQLGVPAVISVHCDMDEQRRHERRLVHRARTVLERYALRRADAVICVTGCLERYARRHGARRVVTIYNRVDPEQFRPAPERRQAGAPLVILSVGRLVRQKYQECLIRALDRVDGVRLVLIGDGELRDHLRALVRRLRLDDRVEFVRAVPYAEIAQCYQAADIFAIATHYEGFCNPVLEAMATGLPVVASRIGPIQEVLGDTGFLVDNTPEMFANALAKLVSDPTLRGEMGEKARRRALTLSGHRMEREEARLYRSLCR